MSRQIARDTLFLRPTPRLAHTEASMQLHRAMFKDSPRELYDAWDYDFVWHTSDGPINWEKAGRATNMGHAEFAPDGADWCEAQPCPFTSVEEVYEFDPVREYGLPSHRELVNYYEGDYAKFCARYPNQLIPGGYYRTVVSGAIMAFGWEMLLLAAADEDRFARVLERFAYRTLLHNLAWAETPIEMFIQHDDMVWTHGPFLRPDFYRRVIFPLYRKLWEPLKRAGKKIIFCSDGTWDMFFDDIAACGADGFWFEPSNNVDEVVRKFGKTHVIMGSKVDCRTMAFGTWEKVRDEIDASLALARRCPGFVFLVGNHIPANVPDEMCAQYMEYLRAHWTR